jgi:hypothetical protein
MRCKNAFENDPAKNASKCDEYSFNNQPCFLAGLFAFGDFNTHFK